MRRRATATAQPRRRGSQERLVVVPRVVVVRAGGRRDADTLARASQRVSLHPGNGGDLVHQVAVRTGDIDREDLRGRTLDKGLT